MAFDKMPVAVRHVHITSAREYLISEIQQRAVIHDPTLVDATLSISGEFFKINAAVRSSNASASARNAPVIDRRARSAIRLNQVAISHTVALGPRFRSVTERSERPINR